MPSCDVRPTGGPLTPEIARTLVFSVSIAAWTSSRSAPVTTTSSRRFWPSGNFSFTSLIAAMPSMVDGRPVISVVPVRIRTTGEAAAMSRTALSTVMRTGRDITALTSRAQKPLPGAREARRSIAARTPRARKSRGSQVIGRPRLTRSPTIASVAGRNVRLPITETSTTAIVPTAIDVNRLIPSVTRPPSEMTTAMPEKNTARPAVELDVSIAPWTVAPRCRSVRKRVIMNRE